MTRDDDSDDGFYLNAHDAALDAALASLAAQENADRPALSTALTARVLADAAAVQATGIPAPPRAWAGHSARQGAKQGARQGTKQAPRAGHLQTDVARRGRRQETAQPVAAAPREGMQPALKAGMLVASLALGFALGFSGSVPMEGGDVRIAAAEQGDVAFAAADIVFLSGDAPF
ncbi:MAG: hypothetical protein AAFQ88_09050 [Pseudomonadota bacterium]